MSDMSDTESREMFNMQDKLARQSVKLMGLMFGESKTCCLLRTALLCDAVAVPATIVAIVFLTSFVYSCYRFLVPPALAEASATTTQALMQKQEIPVMTIQTGEQVKLESAVQSALELRKGGLPVGR